MELVAEREKPYRAADLGSGGGHVAYRLASHAQSVMAIDLSAAMLEAVQETAHKRGILNIETCVAPAEDLPLEDATFDMLCCRFSAHHWRNFQVGVREARRVLKPAGTAIFIDVVSSGNPVFDTHLQAVELLRDPSHVCNYTDAQWTAALSNAGFRVNSTRKRRLRMDFQSWVDRMRTPDVHRVAIRSLQEWASTDTASYFEIEADGSFSFDTLQIEASACRARS